MDIEAGDRAVDLIKSIVRTTARPESRAVLGGFSGAFTPDFSRYRKPVLLSSTDGVGTKLAIAQALDVHTTVGIDLVAMVVDDLVCDGGEPLFLLDYIACGRLIPERVAQIVSGIAEGCRIAGCALVGGETAEHPGMMDADAYDLAAFAVGVAEAEDMPSPGKVQDTDVVIGLASSGLHSNGFSLVRRIILERDLDLGTDPGPLGRSLGEALIEPTRIHAPGVLAAIRGGGVHGVAHITGGGIAGNLARVLPDGLEASIDEQAWTVPQIFRFLRDAGDIPESEMRKTFNMGIGMVLVVAESVVNAVMETLESHGEIPFVAGRIRSGERGVRY